MRKMKRFLAGILTASMLISTESVSVLAAEADTGVPETVQSTESIEATEVIGNTETVEMVTALPTGYIPLPSEYDVPVVHYDSGEVPQLFSNTMETYYVTPNMPEIRDQNPYGTCWAFTSIALGELDLMQSGFAAPDLSELHLAYFTYNSVTDPLGGTEGDSNSVGGGYPVLDRGGNLSLSVNVLAGWTGMADESKVPYDTAPTVEEEGLSPSLAYDDVVHLKNAYFLNIKENPEIVKAMIKEYGGVGTSYYADAYNDGYNSTNNCYYYGQYDTTNHAVTIVGWNDNFSKENFNEAYRPESDGAWLIRNSWGGSYTGDYSLYGYFWMSYEETSIADAAYAFDVTVKGQDDFYDNNYQYDGGMFTASTGMYGGITAANVFKASANENGEHLAAVMFSSTNNTNQTYEIKVYKDLTNPTVPDSGTLVATETGACTYAGIYTVDLAEPVALEAGETFSVVVTLTGGEASYIDYEYPMDAWFVTETSACEGQSYYKSGSSWIDFGANRGSNFRIKAFTNNAVSATGVEVSPDTIELGLGETTTLTANVLPASAGNKNVVWSSNNESVAAVDETGKVTAVGYGVAQITATTVDGGFTASTVVNVTKKLVGISLNQDATTLQKGQQEKLYISYDPIDTITDKTVTWSSLDETVATVVNSVDEEGNECAIVTAIGGGRTVITAQVADKTATCVISVPPTQTNVSAESNEDGSVEITWDAVEDCTKYYIYRREAGAEEQICLARVSKKTTSYTDEQSEDGVRYYYSVSTVYEDAIGERMETESEETYVVYRVLYELGGGANADANPATFCETTETFILADPQHEAGIFEGWYLDADYTEAVTTINPADYAGNVTVYAKWRMRQEIQADWIIYNEFYEYTGFDIVPEIEVRNGDYVLVKGIDYTMSDENDVVGDRRVCAITVTGIGEYIGTQVVTIKEVEATLQAGWVSEIVEQNYNGTAIEPDVTVLFHDMPLVEGTDYTVLYENNVNAGTATVKVIGMDNFTGNVEKNFTILPKELERSFVADIAEQQYVGSALEPEVVITDNGALLTKGVDYIISYNNNDAPGIGTVTIEGCGNYCGTVQVEFVISVENMETLIGDGTLRAMFADGSMNFETVYTGSPMVPEVKLVFTSGKELVNGEDYVVTYENNTTHGTATVIFTAMGDYEGETKLEFTITKALLNDSMVGTVPDVIFNGEEYEPAIDISYNGNTLVKGTDYTVSYENNLNAGTAIVKIAGMGNFEGTLEKSFEIQPKELERNFVADIAEQKYVGEAVEPEVMITDGERSLTEGIDYTVIYSNNEAAGVGLATITGNGNYCGTIQVEFVIKESIGPLITNGSLQALFANDSKEFETVYTGNAVEPPVKLVFPSSGRELINGEDYEVTYENNVSYGSATVIFTAKGNYEGETTLTFTISKAELHDSMIGTISDIVFSAGGNEPEVSVHYNGKTLVKGKDYNVFYENNTGIGTGTAVVEGIGNFEGIVRRNFRIQSGRLQQNYVEEIDEQEYTGSPIEPEVVLKYGDIVLKKNVDYRILFENNVEIGQAEVIIKGRGNYSGTIKVPFEIIGKDLAGLETQNDLTVLIDGSAVAYSTLYTGSAIEPEVTLTRADGTVLVLGKDYEVSYSNNIGPSSESEKATITIAGKGNYSGKLIKTFEIRKHDIENAEVVAGKSITVLYAPTEQKPLPKVVYNGKRLTEGIEFKAVYYRIDESGNRVNGTELEKVTDAGKYELVLKGIDAFTGIKERAATVTVKTRALDSGKVIVENPYARIDGENIRANYRLLFGGTVLAEGTDYVAIPHVSENGDYVTYEFNGTGNYTGTLTRRFRLIAEDMIVFSEGVYEIAAIVSETYTGERICPEISVVKADDVSVRLQEGKDYTVSYKFNLNAGTATAIVTGMGKCIGTMQKEFEILPMEATGLDVLLDTAELIYNGKVQQPSVMVSTKAGVLLKEGVDYTVSYVDASGEPADSKNAGNYQAVILLQGNYAGTVKQNYTITACPVDVLQVEIPDMKYTGAEILPEIADMIVSLNGRELTEEEKAGLTLTAGEHNENIPGEAAVIISSGSNSNFTGWAKFGFNIIAKPVADLMVYVGGTAVSGNCTDYEKEWTGNAIEPEVKILNGMEELTPDKDYTLTYRYNIEIGTAHIIISGKGNYTGKRVLYFGITGRLLSEEKGCTVELTDDNYVYDGTAKRPQVTVKKDGITLRNGEDYTLTYVNNVKAGAAKVIVAGAGYYTGSVSKEFTIAPKTLVDADSVTVSNIAKQRYTGEKIIPQIKITIDGVELAEGKDYSLTVFDAIEEGIATVVATGIGNYAGVLAERPFEIYRTTITYVMNDGENSENNPVYYTAKDSITLKDPKPRDAYNFAGWYSDAKCTKRVYGVKAGTDGNLTFYAKWTTKQVYGIDVSYYQNRATKNALGRDIDWKAVKADGIDFAMIRICDGQTLDESFVDNYTNARKADIKVGIYCYNRAKTVQEAVEQANFVLSKLNGRALDYPICLDMEGNKSALSATVNTDIAYAFKNVVEAAGYDFILYANLDWLKYGGFDNSRLDSLEIWLARWRDFDRGPDYDSGGDLRMWQYSDSGTVDGIYGPVDLDYCFEDYVKK